MSNEAYSLVYPHYDFVFIKMVRHYTCTCLCTSVIKLYFYDRSVVNKYDVTTASLVATPGVKIDFTFEKLGTKMVPL